jgi:hypothetical protein
VDVHAVLKKLADDSRIIGNRTKKQRRVALHIFLVRIEMASLKQK